MNDENFVISNLLKLTLDNMLKWEMKFPPRIITEKTENYIPYYYEANFNGTVFALYEQRQTLYDSENDTTFLGSLFRLSIVKYNHLGVVVDVYPFTADNALYPLYEAVKSSLFEVNTIFNPSFWNSGQ
ncbi:hypothetical protein [Budvicia aquatica]|nr:hypothetical protein [Budvicia aquatica]VFS47430.1 Uncharacterised protein [Budvicia aquatica]